MLNKTGAIVLHYVKYGESSIIVTLYTEKFGRISCMVNGVRSKKPRFPITFFQPLSILETDFYYRQNREIQRLKEATPGYIYATVPYSFTKNAIALFLAEVLSLTLREEESNKLLYSFLIHSLQLLDTIDEGSSWFHHWFMIQLSRFLGFYPSDYAVGQRSLDSDVFNMLSPDAKKALRMIMDNSHGLPDLSGIGNHERNELLDAIIRYYGSHVDEFSRLKSRSVLREVFKF